MKKSVISVLLVAILILAAGCSSGESGEGGGSWNEGNPQPKGPENPASDFEYKYDAAAGGVVITKYIGTAIKVRIPEKIEGEPVVEIGKEAFNRSGIMEVYIPNSVTSIGDVAFYECTGLTGIMIPDSVTSIGRWAFINCPNLTATYKGKSYKYEPPPPPSPDPDGAGAAIIIDLPQEFFDAVNGR
ncbi:MAG: leucine-rich repeat domain-containing protein [Oscillospiraceae bacterium]|nr:leucine-rich repeat domain-containing protein [Oscillospiraceae bacterium]